MKKIRLRVLENCSGNWWWIAICDGNKRIIEDEGCEYKSFIIRAAKRMAKRIDIKYDPKILKLHGC